MSNLRKARDAGDLEPFIAAREAENAPHGDGHKLKRVLASMARTSKEAPAASKRDRSDD